MKKNKKHAFTLAETLITLVIIGVVSALTIPTLLNQHKQQATEAKLKKAYSSLSQAVTMASGEYSGMQGWDWGDGTGSGANSEVILRDYIGKYLKFSKYCGSSISQNCFALAKEWNNITSSVYTTSSLTARAVLQDGTSICLRANSTNSGNQMGTAMVWVDINGLSKPNRTGEDVFLFDIYSDKVNGPLAAWTNAQLTNWCHDKGSVADSSLGNGATCSTKIMRNSWQINYW